jgi:16S rRNA processing protein RimM
MAGNLVHIGKIVTTHGYRGEVKVYPLTDFPERFQYLKEVSLISPKEQKCLLVERVRLHKRYIIMKLKDCHTMSEAEALKGWTVAIPEEQVWPLGEDEYYCFQIIGLDVYTDEGLPMGVVRDVFPTGSNDVYVVKKGQKEYLIPATKEVVKEINLEGRKIIIHLLEGLLDPSDAL